MENNVYSNPLVERYGSKEMLENFSPNKKFSTWRKLWIALAESQKELGLNITDEQIEEMKAVVDNIDYEMAKAKELEVRHDVMAHVHTFGTQAPKAMPIIHLGATSAYVGDNTDLIQIKDGLNILKGKIVTVMESTAKFAMEQKDLPTLGFTHFQPAQLTTVGKRATLWLQSLLLDLEELEFRIETLRFRGVKGTTGTQASYMELFDGDFSKVKRLDQMVAEKMGFDKRFLVTGQTYDRKVDSEMLNLLANIAQSAHKFTNDLRLLQNLKELEEPFGKKQIGSSAMAYKRNPMRSERISSLAKFVIAMQQSTAMTASTQWFERTLDDSANKRLSIPQAFLAVDSILVIWQNVMNGLVVYPKMIEKHVMAELPFMATEYIIMEGVKNGGDRQELHELIRVHSMEAGKVVKLEGKDNDLIERIIADENFNIDKKRLLEILDPKNFVGFASEQTVEFVETEVKPIIEKYSDLLGMEADLRV
ncbi:adenylosuccinate lyase [Propionigenium maris DSM 9537]|uniref:Adenylosuccinate lyase n=1 Tax=Propionigenium maris DSM 9537 TaxID=1123000 RepID=A0A9W6GM59_9FUSO|nr:adenylosuccinate lyase [Propionigenium maris]GLI56369.1 adenylosuccinate lyase [Propionigenium maris DSM 9537]